MPQGQWVAFDASTEESHICGIKNEPDISVKLKKKNKNINKEIELKNSNNTTEIHQYIDRAIREKKRIYIEYNSKHNEEYTEREISPIKKFKEKGRTYLQAYCHKRKDERIFLTRSIISVNKVNKDATKKKIGKPNLKIIRKDREEQNHIFNEPKFNKTKKNYPSNNNQINKKFDLGNEIEGLFSLLIVIGLIGGGIYLLLNLS
ncbi:hypothetical protein PU1002_00540 [Candidatus Pelagibacter ubique HTCC1002]|jgi:hypothetical protein|uniref:WYL domain-containing protein n=1 Tax=Pelagibacter ubique (strain HTCC1002) TaxID=314261 RepID=Q1UZM7_PELU1|nr:WYL domain-containing protein [Candidatus Pelagibacter ubique]EAS84164.1 hypothetical protein PU1002_00540 [Candidatus Pelagibacter ubique HTCC1002]